MHTDKNILVQRRTFPLHTGDVEPSNLDRRPASIYPVLGSSRHKNKPGPVAI
jgi:hypothetical protein